jgi:hypothetical protein
MFTTSDTLLSEGSSLPGITLVAVLMGGLCEYIFLLILREEKTKQIKETKQKCTHTYYSGYFYAVDSVK